MTSVGHSSGPEPLTPEAQRLLAGVPEAIGGAPVEPIAGDLGAAGGSEMSGDETLASLMASVAFEEADVRDTVGELCDWLAERFESDHWRLTDRQGRMMGRPTAQLLNSLWAKLQEKLPNILGQWMDATPGATAFLLAAGIVFGPKVAKQVTLTRAKRKAPALVAGASGPQVVTRASPAPAPVPIDARASLLYTQGATQ